MKKVLDNFYIGILYSFLCVVLFFHEDTVVAAIATFGTYASLLFERYRVMQTAKVAFSDSDRLAILEADIKKVSNSTQQLQNQLVMRR